MAKKKQIPYRNFSSFVLRTPLFPLDFIFRLTSGENISSEELEKVYRLPVVDEAIFLASPDLHSQLHEYLKGKLKDAKKVDRLHYALMRYILRMCTRSTPFGLFAGFCVGKWGDETRIQLPEQVKYSRHTRLDMNYLCALALDLVKLPVIKSNIKYYPNSSIYAVGDQLRYVEYRYRNARRTHHIVAVDRSEYLERVLDVAAGGAKLNQLALLLEDKENDISLEEATAFIDELIESQLLVNDLEPAITGPEFLDQILAVLKGIENTGDIQATIVHIKKTLEELDSGKLGTTLPFYKKIASDLEPLNTKYELKFLFQTDMVKPVAAENCMLDQGIVEDVLSAIDVFNKLSGASPTTNLDQFRDAFFERYETREIPLLQALDTESGVGYKQTANAAAGDIAPLVDDLAIPPSPGEAVQEMKWRRVDSMLFKKYREAIVNNQFQVELNDKDLEPFDSNWDDLPDTIPAMIQVIQQANPEVEGSKPTILITGFGGSSAGNLLGRFCHADEATDTFVREITAKEAELHPDQILAEIIHLPESRVGNVMLRPVLRDYEIPYLAKPAVDKEFQVNLEDLMVSVKFNRVMLRSKKLDQEILPRLTNAHNYSYNALPIYHFLADMQTQQIRGGASFNWSAISGEFPFVPRVTYKNMIFAPATWNIFKKDVEDLLNIKNDDELLKAMKVWRKTRNMPHYVLLVDSDNKLFINLDNVMCIKTLFSVTKKRPSFQLVEFIYDETDTGIKNEEGSFSNEMVLTFYNAEKLAKIKNQPENNGEQK